MNESLPYEDLGHLLDAKADKLIRGEDPEETIQEIMETLGRAESVQKRNKTVDSNGRVSVGRAHSGERGITLFHQDPAEQGDGDE